MKKAALTTIAALLAAAPLVIPIAAQACANPNADARAETAVADPPAIAGALGISGTSIVRVSLNEKGDLVSSSIFSSSGSSFLDTAALQSARAARFVPETRNCRAIAGTYLYEVEF
jgi:protein TonB